MFLTGIPNSASLVNCPSLRRYHATSGSVSPSTARKKHVNSATVRTSEAVTRIRSIIEQDRAVRLNRLESAFGTSRSAMQTSIRKDLGYRSYALGLQQMLSTKAKEKDWTATKFFSIAKGTEPSSTVASSRTQWPRFTPEQVSLFLLRDVDFILSSCVIIYSYYHHSDSK